LITLKYIIWTWLRCEFDRHYGVKLTRNYDVMMRIWPGIMMNLTQNYYEFDRHYDEFDPALWCNFPENVPKMFGIFIYPEFDQYLYRLLWIFICNKQIVRILIISGQFPDQLNSGCVPNIREMFQNVRVLEHFPDTLNVWIHPEFVTKLTGHFRNKFRILFFHRGVIP
jgi:hypothetical protein